MAELALVRKWFADHSTEGELSLDGAFQCYTLEDPVRHPFIKIPGQTAIPAGRYKVVIDFSTRFRRYMLHILDVPDFSGIRIHAGNTDKDTEGCVLVGLKRGQEIIFSSKDALNSLFSKLAVQTGFDKTNDVPIYALREETWITISEEQA